MKNINDLIKRLKAYNDWRTGKIDGEYPVEPFQITKDLNEVIKILSKIKDKNTKI
jgi:hypothetical protein